MGRPKLQIDESTLLEMRARGATIYDLSRHFGASRPTISRRIAYLKHKKGLLTKYRELQGLHLTELQFRVLEAITPERLDSASLSELVRSVHILEKAMTRLESKNSLKINRLVDYLQKIERLEGNGC